MAADSSDCYSTPFLFDFVAAKMSVFRLKVDVVPSFLELFVFLAVGCLRMTKRQGLGSLPRVFSSGSCSHCDFEVTLVVISLG